jgi:hypothetical protein
MEVFKSLLLLLITLILVNNVRSCDILISQIEQHQKFNPEEFIKTHIEKISSDYKTCLSYLIRHGQYNVLETLLNELLTHGIKFKNELNKSISDYFQYLKEFKSKFDYIESDYQIVRPAVKWAQNKEYVFMEIKYSHRHDSPGCAETEEESFELPGVNEAWFQAYCMQGDTPIKFELNLNLFAEVVKLQSDWGSSSSGKFKVTLRKQSPEYWKQLLKEGEEQPQNFQRWFEMESEYEQKMEKEMNEKEEEEFDEEIKQIQKKKRNRKKNEWNGLAY